MRPYSLPFLLSLLPGALTCLPAAAQSSVNLSHDLITLGIAKQNLEPNTPTLDAQPLVSAAIQYAQKKNVALLIADPGTYYFLNAPSGPAYVYLGNVSNLTIDFQGSNLKIQDGMLRIFELEYCKSVTLRNFTVDQIVPRYTQVRLTSVNADKGTIFYAVPAGWADPATFTAASGFGTPQLFAAFYRNNEQVAATSLAFINYPVASPILQINSNGEPWTRPDVLKTLLPGDMVAVWDRSGLESILVNFSDSIMLSNIEIHGSGGGFAVQVASSSNSIADNVRIKPRPGGLIGSNADGIHFSFSLFNNHIRNCYVTRTTDDAIGLDSDFVASVSKQSSKRQIIATRNFGNRAANGSMMNFVQIATTGEIAGGMLVSQDPPDSPNVAANASVTFTFDRDLPTLSAGDEIVFANSNMRSGGSTVEDNVVEDITYGRGIYLGGIEDVIVQRNVIRGTSNAGINISEVVVPAGGGGLPSHGVTIQNNAIENVLGPQASGAGLAIVNQAGIVVSSNNQNFDFVATPVNSNISILNNYVGGSGRAGIWVAEVDQGAVSGNVIVNWNQHPELPVWQTPPYPGDLSQPLVVRFSQGIAQSGNIIQASSPLLTPVTLSPPSVSLMGADRGGAFIVSTAVPGFSWVAASQDSWLNILSGTPGAGPGSVQYAVAPNSTGAQRAGTITVAGVVFSVVQSPVNGLPIANAAGVANAASYAAGTVAPGEIVTIFGNNFGPALLAGATLVNGLVSTQIASTQVLFDGVPAPMIYAAANQVSAIVPYSVHGSSTQMVISYGAVTSQPVTLNVAPSAPGLFTADSSGSGQGAFLNSNASVNSAGNPAAKGSIVTLFATGEGVTNPAGVDGKLAVPPYAAPILPVMVTIDGTPVEIDYKGAAPAEVAGVMQLNVRVPATAQSGNLPVVLTVGAVPSKPVTLAVR